MNEPSTSLELARVVAEEVTPEISHFMGTVMGSPGLELGELVTDQIRAWRFKRGIKYVQRAMKQLEDAGMNPKAVPMRTLAPLMDGGTLEDDEEMGARWASLLANAASGEREVPPSFASVLRDLEPEQARILDHVYQTMMQIAPELRKQNLGMARMGIVAELGLSNETLEYHLDNLIRLRLIRRPSGVIDDELEMVTLTEFGRAFVRACRPPSQPDPPVRFTDAAQVARQASENRQRLNQIADSSASSGVVGAG
jgi:Abortive infection alpha